MNITKQNTFNNGQGIRGCIIFFVSAICVLNCASASSKGAFEGLKICSNIIIPSLFPFTVLTILFQKNGGLLWVGKKLNKLTCFLFKITGLQFSVILLSLIGGYPIGAKIINELYKSGDLNEKDAKKLLRFCVNPSPAFFVSAFGINILKNKTAGVILLISNLISCLTLNIIFNRNKMNICDGQKQQKTEDKSISDSFVESVFESTKIILNICAFVTLFSSIAEILMPIFKNPRAYALFCPVLEISFGISNIKNSGLSTCFYSFFLAFGGISTIFQIKQAASKLKPSFLEILIFRTVHGLFATIISFILFKNFPQSAEVFSNGMDIKFSGYTLFFPSVMLIIFSVLFLMFLSPENKGIDNLKKHKYNF